MTLVVVAQVELSGGPALLVATDSMLSTGYRWPRGPKLFSLGGASVMAFEGETDVAYPLLLGARNFIDLSDVLWRKDADPGTVFARVRIDVSEAYGSLRHDPFFGPQDPQPCSLILAGWERRGPVVQVLRPPPLAAPRPMWRMTDVVAGPRWQQHRCFFAGNGQSNPVAAAWDYVAKHGGARFAAYDALLDRLRDPKESSVGGSPQIALLTRRRRTFVGVRDGNERRFLLGQPVAGGGHGVEYYEETLTDLP